MPRTLARQPGSVRLAAQEGRDITAVIVQIGWLAAFGTLRALVRRGVAGDAMDQLVDREETGASVLPGLGIRPDARSRSRERIL